MSGGLKIQTQVNLAGKSCSFHGIIMATSEEKRILTRMPRHTKFSEIIHRVNLPKKKHKKSTALHLQYNPCLQYEEEISDVPRTGHLVQSKFPGFTVNWLMQSLTHLGVPDSL